MKNLLVAAGLACLALSGCDANQTSKQGTYETSRLPDADESAVEDTGVDDSTVEATPVSEMTPGMDNGANAGTTTTAP